MEADDGGSRDVDDFSADVSAQINAEAVSESHNAETEFPLDQIVEESNASQPENQKNSQLDDDQTALVAAAVADFEDDQDEDEGGDDDTVNVIIKPSSKAGIYKTGAAYQARSAAHVTQHQKPPRQGIELDDPGNINGVPTMEFNLSTLGEEDKPWKRPGADITDYFNYGFTEETWIQYCEKQKILRQEYANTTLKPVLSSGGASLLQRIRTGAATSGIRSFDNFKQGNINVINLSNSVLGARNTNVGLLQTAKLGNVSDPSTVLLNGNSAANNTNLIGQFTQPPPGYLGGTQQAVGNAGTSAMFNLPPLGFPTLTPGATSQLLGNGNTGEPVLLENLLVPPVANNLQNWATGGVSISSLMGAGDPVIDPTTGQITGFLDHGGRSPESVGSNDDQISRRSRRQFHPDEMPYYDRESYRSRRRSRSSSRERHHSKHRRHHDSSRGDRDYERRSGTSRHSRRSREERYSGGYPGSEDPSLPPASHRGSERKSERDRDRYERSHARLDRSRERDRSRHRDRRDRERSPRSSRRQDHHSGSRSSRRRENESPEKSPKLNENEQASPMVSKPQDPLAVAAAAAANIAAVLSASN